MFFPQVIELFPTPLLAIQYPNEFTEQEKQCISSMNWMKNKGNLRSVNSYVLELPEFANLKSFVMETLETYLQQIVQPKQDVHPYLTQSWLNKTERGQFHHSHYHPNSFLSGVFYLETHDDMIIFSQTERKLFSLPPREVTNLNAENFTYKPSAGEILVFPSYFWHQVEVKQTEGSRISLAFNSLVRGMIGDENMFTGGVIS